MFLLACLFICSQASCFVLEDIAEGGGGNVLPDDSPDPADLRNWDYSACVDDFDAWDTCWDLFWDNSHMFPNNDLTDVFDDLSLEP